jgi:hypothetical protein
MIAHTTPRAHDRNRFPQQLAANSFMALRSNGAVMTGFSGGGNAAATGTRSALSANQKRPLGKVLYQSILT